MCVGGGGGKGGKGGRGEGSIVNCYLGAKISHSFSLTLYNFRNIGGGGSVR